MAAAASPAAASRAALAVLLSLGLGAHCTLTPVAVNETYGTEFVTPLSGFPGDSEIRVLRTGIGTGAAANLLRGVRWGEAGNRPCRANALYDRPAVDEIWDGCPRINLSGKTVRFDEPGVFVRSIRVCANDRNHRVKGIEIWGGRLSVHGVEPDDDQHEWEHRANCDNRGKNHEWRQRRNCPGDMAAQGLVLAVETKVPNNVDDWSDIKHSITGIGLICIPARIILQDGS